MDIHLVFGVNTSHCINTLYHSKTTEPGMVFGDIIIPDVTLTPGSNRADNH